MQPKILTFVGWRHLMPHPAQAANREWQKPEQSACGLGACGLRSACASPQSPLSFHAEPAVPKVTPLQSAQTHFCQISQSHPTVLFPGIRSHIVLTHSLLLMSSPGPWAQQWLKARKGKVPLEWWGPGQCNHHHCTASTRLYLPWDWILGKTFRWCKLVAERSLQSQVYIGWSSSFSLCSYKSQQDQQIPPSSWEYKTTQDCTKEFPKLSWEIADKGLWRCKHIFFL